jgi:hypothetical protein
MPDAICEGGFDLPDVTSFCRLDGLGLVVTGQDITAEGAVLACRVADRPGDGWYSECGGKARARDRGPV